MARLLCSWLGTQDLKCVADEKPEESPLLQTALHLKPTRLELLWCESNNKTTLTIKDTDLVKAWLERHLKRGGVDAEIIVSTFDEHSARVMNFEWVYERIDDVLRHAPKVDEIFANASSGTPIMTAAWIVRSRAVANPVLRLYVSSREEGVAPLPLPEKLWIDMETLIGVKTESQLVREYIHGSLWAERNLFQGFWGSSRALMEVKERAFLASQIAHIPVLILGERGTGKTRLAKEIHNMSRRPGEFVVVDCGHLSGDAEINSIFGWAKGSFTDAKNEYKGLVYEADHGTLFLDEIGNLPPAQQSKLLGVIQNRTYRQLGSPKAIAVDIQILAATNADLYAKTRAGEFRYDLYDRLACVKLRMPSLRECRADIFTLAKQKLDEFQDSHSQDLQKSGIHRKSFSPTAERVLRRHSWPGNIRELEHLIARLVIFSERNATKLGALEVAEQLEDAEPMSSEAILNRPFDDDFALDLVVEEVQRHYIERASIAADGNKTEMAKILGYKSRTPLQTLLRGLRFP